MITNQPTHLQALEQSVRQVKAWVELFDSSAASTWYGYDTILKSFTIERVGESKFFGYGYNQKANIKLIDANRELDITTDYSFTFHLTLEGVDGSVCPFPRFYVTEVNRDENTGELSITAYDGLKAASAHTVAELGLEAPYTIAEFASACAQVLGYQGAYWLMLGEPTLSFDEGANFEGTETIREALDAIAEATQTIYFLNYANDIIIFRRLSRDGEADLEITKDKYITLDSKTNRRLQAITSATDLGDNVTASIEAIGTTQYIRNNPFWELREDIDTLLQSAIDSIGGITINQFDCSWRGNYLLELGDKLALTTKDGGVVTSYFLNDTITYDGGFSQKTEWSYEEDEAETASNSNTLGEALKQTFARVDKANKQIDLLVSESDANKENVSSLQMTTNNINMTIQSMQKNNADAMESVNSDISELKKQVSATMTDEAIKLEIESQLENGVTKVETNTGFTFNDEGLTISKSNSEIETTITEDGMTVYKSNEAVLEANNEGVKAVDLHATTYLIIGTNSRFEDFNGNRTGCFWIGGNN